MFHSTATRSDDSLSVSTFYRNFITKIIIVQGIPPYIKMTNIPKFEKSGEKTLRIKIKLDFRSCILKKNAMLCMQYE